MAFKRKRSMSNDSPLSTSSCSSTSTCDPQSPSPPSRPMGSVMDFSSSFPSTLQWPSQPTASFPRARLSATDLSSRTRKRFRDNRPDVETIHENTLSLLFSAARAPHPSPTPSQSQPLTTKHEPTQKSTLHAFWALPAPRAPVFSHVHLDAHTGPNPPQQGLPCEDCDSALEAESMEIDEMGEVGDEFACAGCRRRVCGMCAVAGDERRCLRCVGVGGGW
ncbi:hypothetical protein BU16DRAFT_522496 [Lophium mytilinum]|uniref:Uncharacterized protein n=1 Tax=Lophium mytilinum TaxID=390894 RepID=A0A6A6R9W1_9PEZI|nr:hypothetical protein BU16DRAFT_522496 [Lophium mytilinum]